MAINQFSIRPGIKKSAILHGFILLAIAVKSIVAPSDPEIYVPSLRVDIVDLPQLTRKELETITPGKPIKEKEAEIIEAPKPETKSDDMVLKEKDGKKKEKKLNALEDKKTSALTRIRALEKIKTRDQTEEEKALIRGNKLSAGASTSGDAKETADPRYEDTVLQAIRQNWTLPIWLSRQNLSALIQIKIESSGRVASKSFQRSSGNKQFDNAVLQAIDDSQPFDAPPEKDRSRILDNGILLGFPL